MVSQGYFDDGAPLGSAESDECRIDSIAQSWAVLSGAATPERAALAMGALDRQLIRRSDGLALLFTPPFDRTTHDPGYIKAYPPGVRENGGQYTHAATWSVMAFAALGEGDKAAGLFSLLNPSTTRGPRRRLSLQGRAYIVCADLYRQRRMSGEAAGPGTRARRAAAARGCRRPPRPQIPRSVLVVDPCIQRPGPVRGDGEVSNRAIFDLRRESRGS